MSAFHAFEKGLNGESSSPFHQIRKAAIARFAETGFPTTRDEEWKYTDISPLTKIQFTPAADFHATKITKKDIDRFTLGNLTPHLLVCVNGCFSASLSSLSSLPSGVYAGSLRTALKKDGGLVEQHLARHARYDHNAFVALSTAFLNDGAFVHIPDGAIIQEPLHVLFVSNGHENEFIASPRHLIVLGKNSQASIIESHMHVGTNTYISNAVAEIVLGENAVLEYDRLQNENMHSYHIGTTQVYQERNSNFRSHAVTFGGAIVRNNITAVLDGEGCECTLNGLYLGTGNQLIDNHTAIDHAKPHCNSHELYKGILDDTSRGVFNGKIFVRKDAQKTDAKQTNKNLILSDGASIDTKPQLEIFANDVKCTHGATIGQLDDEQIFYLRARGIGQDAARDMLIFAFASDIIDRMNVEPLRNTLNEILHAKLEHSRSM